MSLLWKRDPVLLAHERLQSWPRFHQALRRQGLHIVDPVNQGVEWRVQFCCLIGTRDYLFRQHILDAFAPTLLLALADGVRRLADGPLFNRRTSLLCRLHLADMLLETALCQAGAVAPASHPTAPTDDML